MNRLQISVAALLGALMPQVFDSALKGAALLAAAALCALVLYKASAATRHLVWLVAVVALLVVPVLSFALPQWRILPQWTASPLEEPVTPAANIGNAAHASFVTHESYPVEPSAIPPRADNPVTTPPVATPIPPIAPSRVSPLTPPEPARAWRDWLPLAWAAGFVFLALRLLAAHLLLRRAARGCTALTAPPDGFIAAAFTDACAQLGIRQRVTLLLDGKRTIPVVWGVFRPRLLLPAEAREWNEEQLRSVLLHELAHIRRRDTLVQWITQIACALHWFNPLVWLAAWRLHTERERACDDLVLASGVRPSAYAEHLLHVATKLSPARWTAACGLAMARKSSLEGRLLAVLSERLNRRGLTRALTAAALLLGAAVAIPIAMLRAQDDKPAAASDAASKKGATLNPGAEAQLDWGEAVNGLRGAVVVRSPKAGAAPGVYLAVQNVSAAALRFSDTIAAEEMRKLYVSAPAGRILVVLTNGEPTNTDALLQPREVVFLPMFPPGRENEEAVLIEGLRKDALQTWKVVLEIQNAPEGAWKGKLITAETRGAVGTEGPQPKSKEGRALFKLWQNYARLNGNIPGGLLSRLHDKVKEFIRNNTGDASGDPYAKKMAPLELRFGAAGDWKPSDVVALFDDIAAVTTIPLDTTMDFLGQHTLQHGRQLPAALQKADWGEPLEGGLRMAFLLEPRAEEYRFGTEVKARIVLHNSGKEPVAFITQSFQQPGHKAMLTGGADFKIDSTYWTTLGRPEAYRLSPGEYCEVYTPGLGIGERIKDHEDWSNVRAGSWILCGEGDEVTFIPGAVMLTSNETPADPGWWQEFIAERLGREAPVPLDTKEREYLLYRVVRELFGTAPSTTEGDAFAADKSPDALKNLAVLLAKHPYGKRCEGPIRAGETKFRVIAPDPDAAKKPRVAKNPGRYNIGDIVRLVVTRSGAGERIVNNGRVVYFPPGKDNVIHDLKLPDGHDSWAAGWAPGTTVLWVTQKGLLRKVDFTDPAKVTETRYEGDKAAGAPTPPDIRAALTTALTVPEAPKQEPEPLQPAPAAAPATPAPGQESKQPKQGVQLNPAPMPLKDKQAQKLYELWQYHARVDGKIPGGLIGWLHAKTEEFVKMNRDANPDSPHAKKVEPILPRFDASYDWSPDEAVKLLNDLAALSDGPISNTLVDENRSHIRPGQPLPAEWKEAPWGEPSPEGLRMARPLAPRADSYPIGALLDSRILLHNAGKVPVLFPASSWMQPGYEARDGQGSAVKVGSANYLTLSWTQMCRLAPGEYMEIPTPGLGIGKGAGNDGWPSVRLGHWLEVTEPGDITLTPAGVTVSMDDIRSPIKTGEQLKLVVIRERLDRESPLPASAADREKIVRRVTKEIFGVDPTADEIAAFVSSRSGDPVSALANHLLQRAGLETFIGELKPGEIKFRTTPADPDAANREKVAIGPGEYILGTNVMLTITGKSVDGRRTSDAEIHCWGVDPAPKPHKIEVPDGFGTWSITSRPKSGILYVLTKGAVRKIDYSNPAQVKETPVTRGSAEDMADEFREAVKRMLTLSGVPAEQITALIAADSNAGKTPSKEPISGAQMKPATEQKLKWGEPANGLRMALAWPPTLGEPGMGDAPEFHLVVQNVSDAAVRFTANDAAPNPRRLMMRDKGSPLQGLRDPTPMPGDWLLQSREVAFVRLFQQEKDGHITSAAIEENIRVFPEYSMTAEMSIEKDPAGAWTGKLSTGETRGSVDVIPPKHKDAQALLKSWMTAARTDGKIPGALMGKLGEDVKTFIKSNPAWPTTPQLEKMLPRFDASHDWSGQDAVALLDELAAVQDSPVSAALEHEEERIIRTGLPLLADLTDAPWGETLTNGLRLAWLLEPRTEEHRLGTPLKSRILIHNAGKEPVVFRTRTWHQGGHTARDAKGADIKVDAVTMLTRPPLVPFRLAPGEFVELNAPGIGIGPMKSDDEVWQNISIGSWIEAKARDEVTVTTGPVPLLDWNEEEQLTLDGKPRWWLDFITARLSRHLPFPAGKDARERLLYRIAMELFGTPVPEEINKAFGADNTPNAIDSLALLLFHRPGQHAWAGPLVSAPTKFRVLPADPDAVKKPRTASNPGQYTLGGHTSLVITRRPDGGRIVNEAHLSYSPPKETIPALPHEIKLPDGYHTWAAAWIRGTTVLWVTQKGLLRKYDFTNFQRIEETRYEGDKMAEAPLPADIFEALGAALAVPGVATQKYVPLNSPPADPAPAAPKKKKEGADAKPKRNHFFDDQFSAVAVQSGDEVKFVLFHHGFISSAMSDWSYGSDPGWGFEGHVHLVDRKKTREAGKNVNARSVAVKYTSEAPDTLFLDGKAYDLTKEEKPGRVFILRENGEPLRSDRTLALRDDKDLVKLGELANAALAAEVAGVADEGHTPRVRKRDSWSAEFLARCKAVAESRGLKQWQPDDVIAWGPEVGGMRSGLLIEQRVAHGGRLPTWLVLRNSSKESKDVKLVWSWNATDAVARDANGKALKVINLELFGVDAIHPVTLHPNEQIEMRGPPVEFGGEVAKGLSCHVETDPGKVLLRFDLTNLPGPETGEVAITVAGPRKSPD